MTASTQTRPLFLIAREIRREWAKPYFGAVPYIDAMSELTDTSQTYGWDPAADIVRYFLANAGTWRGEAARRIKAELKEMVK